jgi:erythromycin esterase-like protein
MSSEPHHRDSLDALFGAAAPEDAEDEQLTDDEHNSMMMSGLCELIERDRQQEWKEFFDALPAFIREI